MSNAVRVRRSFPSSPRLHRLTWYPSYCSTLAQLSRSVRSSSTIRMRIDALSSGVSCAIAGMGEFRLEREAPRDNRSNGCGPAMRSSKGATGLLAQNRPAFGGARQNAQDIFSQSVAFRRQKYYGAGATPRAPIRPGNVAKVPLAARVSLVRMDDA